MDYALIWFGLIGLLWAGYLVLEGFDFGVGALLPVLGKGNSPQDTEKRRRVMLNTIGPHWDGNEVWLLTAGGATFAAFPEWYATMFSAFYLPLLILLVALIVRNMGFEYRGKRNDETWRKRWDLAIIGGSIVAPLLVGIALTNVVRGLPIDNDLEFTGNLFTLLNPMSLLGGLVILGLSLTHGAFFLALKTTGDIRRDARALGTTLGLVSAVLAVVLLLWLGLTRGTTWSWITTAIAAVSLLAAIYANVKEREGWAFIGTAVTFASAVATYFLTLYPNVMPTTLPGGSSLTLENAASSELTLKIMTVAALVFTPIVLLYTAWTYWTFRKRLGTQHMPAPVSVK
jgi:cytochrome d ubiquinol oxidase subunit II